MNNNKSAEIKVRNCSCRKAKCQAQHACEATWIAIPNCCFREMAHHLSPAFLNALSESWRMNYYYYSHVIKFPETYAAYCNKMKQNAKSHGQFARHFICRGSNLITENVILAGRWFGDRCTNDQPSNFVEHSVKYSRPDFFHCWGFVISDTVLFTTLN